MDMICKIWRKRNVTSRHPKPELSKTDNFAKCNMKMERSYYHVKEKDKIFKTVEQ